METLVFGFSVAQLFTKWSAEGWRRRQWGGGIGCWGTWRWGGGAGWRSKSWRGRSRWRTSWRSSQRGAGTGKPGQGMNCWSLKRKKMIIAKCTHHHEINFQFLIVRINTIYFLHKSLEFLFFDCIGRISSACKPIELVLEPSIKTGKICCVLAKGDQSTKKSILEEA